jgi:hypothetical protein
VSYLFDPSLQNANEFSQAQPPATGAKFAKPFNSLSQMRLKNADFVKFVS